MIIDTRLEKSDYLLPCIAIFDHHAITGDAASVKLTLAQGWRRHLIERQRSKTVRFM
ncbi:MAG: hypothetical protein HZC38_15425 [Chloroflexi bacterium]|nr:hypothetical protein [Chloroflexota bacterium]MBI5714788.1 hypothetical protein [Chloroflexota bacterium]